MSKISEKLTRPRIDWIDQIRGFVILMTLYVNNHPFSQRYISCFILPLALVISGFFHPSKINKEVYIKRIKRILLPYFLWAILLFVFWFFIGRFYGESVKANLSVWDNLLGIFYAQGANSMDWGIPLWFLPFLFFIFLVFILMEKIENIYVKYTFLLMLPFLGFYLPKIFKINFFWSFDVVLTSIIFYAFGFYFKTFLLSSKSQKILFLLGLVHFFLFNYNIRVNMYRSFYGNQVLFFINGLSGAMFYIALFKFLPKIKILSFLGKNTITILATQLRAMTFIKLFMVIGLGVSVFNFSEIEKFLLSIIQVLIILPVIYVVNKYIPILNGLSKKNR